MHYTPEELTKLGFSNAEQDAYINWSTRQVKMYYNGEEYTSDKYLPQTNVDNSAEINFDINMVYEDGRYKVKVIPEENKAGLSVTYKKEDSDTWLHADGYSFEYADYGTTEVKLSDQNGNESIKTITQTQETVTTTGEIATLNGTLGEKVLSYTVTNPEANSNIKVVGKNLFNINSFEQINLAIIQENKIIFDGSSIEGNIATSFKIQKYLDTVYKVTTYASDKIGFHSEWFIKDDSFNALCLRINTNKNDPMCIKKFKYSLVDTKKYMLSYNVDELDYNNAKAIVSHIQLEEGDTATSYEPYTETDYTIENTSSLPDITTKKGETHVIVNNTSDENLAASYTYIKTVIE